MVTFFFLAFLFCMVMAFITRKNNRKSNEIQSLYEGLYQEGLERNNLEIQDNIIIEKYKLNFKQISTQRQKAKEKVFGEILEKYKENNMLSPESADILFGVLEKLELNRTSSPMVFTQVSSLQKYWEIMYLPLPTIQTNINLQKNEVCYYHGNCKWYEYRTTTKSVSYSGFSTSIKIAKGIRYNVGTYAPRKITQTQLQQIDNGNLFVTNKRIIFIGGHKNTNIRLSNVLSIKPYSDAVEVEKSSGKSPILNCADSDILTRILLKVIYIGSDESNAEDAQIVLPSNQLDERVLDLIMNKQKLEAVKLLCDERGMTLKQAKDYVDALSR